MARIAVRTIIWSLFATRVPGHVQPTRWMALWHLDALSYEGCEGHGTANGLPQPRMELAENRPIWEGIVDGAKLFYPLS